jgi:hypothetical protein
MMQLHWRQWHLRPMVAATMTVIVVNCAVVVDAATSNDEDYNFCCLRLPSLLPHSPRSTAVAVFIDCNSNGKGRRGQGWTRVQGLGRKGGGKGGKVSKGKGNCKGGKDEGECGKGSKGGKGGKGKSKGKGSKGWQGQ